MRLMLSLIIGAVLIGAAGSTSAADFSGYWTLDSARSEAWPQSAALTAAASDAVAKFDPLKKDPARVCMPYGMPRVMNAAGASPMEIVQTSKQVTLLFDSHDEIRRVFIDGRKHPEELDTNWLGHAIGRWDGDALLIDTRGMTPDTPVTASGVPHSAELIVTERIERIEGGKVLRNRITLTDPAFYPKPVTRTFYYQQAPEVQQREFNCAEQMWLDHVTLRAKELTRELGMKGKQP